jgi:hypothetical protein
MKKNLYLLTCLVALFILKPNSAKAQYAVDSTKLYHIEINDGSEFIGNIISEADTAYQFLSGKYGQLTIMKSDIKKISHVEKATIVKGKLWSENPQSARYLLMPNGYGLKAGEGYYQNIWVLFNQASVGVTDYFSVGAGLVPTFLFGTSYIPFWVVPKFSIPVVKDKFNLGVGAFVGTIIGESNSGFGILYGSATVGNRNSNITLGLGYGYASGSLAKRPMINLSAMTRYSPRGYLLTENYYIKVDSESLILLSFGGRSMFNKAGLDYGLFVPVTSSIDSFIAIPWLGFTVPFGKVTKSPPKAKYN